MKKRVLIVVSLLGFSAVALYAAWQLDESKQLVQTDVLESSRAEGRLVVEMRERTGDDFIVICPEERFQKAFAELKTFVDVSTDPLVAPGGPMILAWADFEVPENFQSAHQVLQDFLQRYSPRRVVLVSHSECLYYEGLAVWHDRLDEVKERQLQDLERARSTILRWLPDTEVEIYYADKDGNRLTFSRLGQRG